MIETSRSPGSSRKGLAGFVAWLSACALLAGCWAGWSGGIHAVVRYRGADRTLIVEQVPRDGASGRAGLAAGDRILRIDGVEVAELTAEAVRERLRGEVGTIVRVRVLRDGRERDIAIERAPYR